MEFQSTVRSVSLMEQSGDRHNHDEFYEFHYIVQGTGLFLNGSRQYAFTDGSLFFSPPNVDHRLVIHRGQRNALFYLVLFSIDDRDGPLLAHVAKRFPGLAPLHIGTDCRLYFEDIRRKAQSDNELVHRSALLAFESFLYQIAGQSTVSFALHRDHHVEKAISLMYDRVQGNLDLDEVCAALGLNKSYFIRRFKRDMGMPPAEYYTRLKMETASYMLKESDIPVYEVANRLGFADQFHFSNVFKRRMGMSPRAYRDS